MALTCRPLDGDTARMEPLPVTDRTRTTRLAERQVTDRQALYDVLDAGLVAHVSLVRDGLPVVLPVGYARRGDDLLLHGSTGGGLLRAAAAGAPLAVTVTLLDGLVYARSLFDSSMNYRSAMICGSAQPLHGVPDQQGRPLLLLELDSASSRCVCDTAGASWRTAGTRRRPGGGVATARPADRSARRGPGGPVTARQFPGCT